MFIVKELHVDATKRLSPSIGFQYALAQVLEVPRYSNGATIRAKSADVEDRQYRPSSAF